MNKYKAKLIKLPKGTVFYRHGVLKSINDMNEFILEAGEEATKNNPDLKCVGDYCYVCYFAHEYKAKDVELEYAQLVEKEGKASKNIKFKQIQEQTAVSVLHKGSYLNLGEAYSFAINFVKEKGYSVNAPIRERYINGCWNCDDENDYLTEIQIPISEK